MEKILYPELTPGPCKQLLGIKCILGCGLTLYSVNAAVIIN